MPFREAEEIKTERSPNQSDDQNHQPIRCSSKSPTEKESKISENVYSLHSNETRDPDSRTEEKSENSGTLDPEDPLNITVQDLNEVSKPEEVIQGLFKLFCRSVQILFFWTSMSWTVQAGLQSGGAYALLRMLNTVFKSRFEY